MRRSYALRGLWKLQDEIRAALAELKREQAAAEVQQAPAPKRAAIKKNSVKVFDPQTK